jgi:hypothetical protein
VVEGAGVSQDAHVLAFYKKVAGLFGGYGPVVSVLLFVAVTVLASAAVIVLLVWLPVDHFRSADARPAANGHVVFRVIARGFKNLLGLALLPLGVVMALPLVPGPGLVLILIGLSLIDFPGKRRFERRMLNGPHVRPAIDGIRRYFGRAPFTID